VFLIRAYQIALKKWESTIHAGKRTAVKKQTIKFMILVSIQLLMQIINKLVILILENRELLSSLSL
jgi:hypothetical protein